MGFPLQVLWLLGDAPQTERHLRREWANAGLAPAKLFFSGADQQGYPTAGLRTLHECGSLRRSLRACECCLLALTGRVDVADHLQRLSLADLFVDTPQYNGGTTGAPRRAEQR